MEGIVMFSYIINGTNRRVGSGQEVTFPSAVVGREVRVWEEVDRKG